jgi:hypothetical protein
MEIVSDYSLMLPSCRVYADEEFGSETLQMEAFRLHYLTFAASSRLMATAQASPPHAATSTCRLSSNQVLYPMSGLGFPLASDLVLRPTLG